ncbi:DNA-binding transcriptional LysR family regulator [Gracilibacillus halotolerans]|uniref:DNA-binding transcriptional LysR family regulator n=1 Tax=Gracilibacillus halotolerans TaxID=74386 RepID=A0A841RMC8_9BACI|nr:DNA-binding transcriptional LysR family regulator [Gracilibacillus halotolerans]
MEFKDLEIFQLVAEKGTITGAARELNYVQSNITSRIRKLEAEMKTPLFNRHRRGMSLTPEGKRLLTYTSKLLSLKEDMEQSVQTDQEPSGKLEIGTIESVIHLPKILSSYVKQYKKVDLSLFTGVTESLVSDVLNHKLDGAFVTERDFPSDIISHNVFEEELVIVSDTNLSSVEALQDKTVLCFSEGCGYRARLMNWFKDQQMKPSKIMEFGTLETILRSAVVGLGVAFVPISEVKKLHEERQLYFHSLPEQYSKIRTVFIRRKDTHLTPTIQKFIDTIEENEFTIASM